MTQDLKAMSQSLLKRLRARLASFSGLDDQRSLLQSASSEPTQLQQAMLNAERKAQLDAMPLATREPDPESPVFAFGKRKTPLTWKPVEVSPNSPAWELWNALANEREKVEILDSKRLDLEARLKVAEAQASEKVATLSDTARLLREIENWRGRAEAERGRAEILREAIEYAIMIDDTGSGDGMVFLGLWNEGRQEEMRELEAYRTGKQNAGPKPIMHGKAGAGRDEMSSLSIGLGRERPKPAPVRPEAKKERATPISADMAAVVEAFDRGEVNLATDLYMEVGKRLRREIFHHPV